MAAFITRSECRADGFWHVITYDISDPDNWIQVEDLPTTQPCREHDHPTIVTLHRPDEGLLAGVQRLQKLAWSSLALLAILIVLIVAG